MSCGQDAYGAGRGVRSQQQAALKKHAKCFVVYYHMSCMIQVSLTCVCSSTVDKTLFIEVRR